MQAETVNFRSMNIRDKEHLADAEPASVSHAMSVIMSLTWRAELHEDLLKVSVFVPKKRVGDVYRALYAVIPAPVSLTVEPLSNPLKQKKYTYFFKTDI